MTRGVELILWVALAGIVPVRPAWSQDVDSAGAEPAHTEIVGQLGNDARESVGFASSRSVESELAETAERQQEGRLEGFRARKKNLEVRTGLAYGLDNHTLYLDTDSDRSPSDAASNVTRFYGTWTTTGLGTPKTQPGEVRRS